MNKLNRLHVLGAVFVLALLMLFKTVQTQGKIADAAAENTKTEQLGKQITQMKSAWEDPKKMQQRIDQVMGNNAFKSYVTKKEKAQNVYRVRLQNMPAGVFDKLTTKLLNETVAVKQLQMTRSGEQNVSVTVEFIL